MAPTVTTAARFVAPLRPEQDPAGKPSDRPDGVYLQNDRVWHFWLEPDHEYELKRDDLGWVVNSHSWPGGHTYRLASDGYYVDQLPMVGGGSIVLDATRPYAIRRDDRWTLYEL